MATWRLALILLAALALAACRESAPSGPRAVATVEAAPAAAEPESTSDEVNIVVAPSLAGTVDEQLIRTAFRQAVAQGERDFSLRPKRTITVYVDPDSSIGLEDALGLSAKYAMHLRAGRARSMSGLMPLMMHEYTHVLQYQIGRLRPQWWIEGQADHEAVRVRDPASAERERRALYGRLADDVRAGRAPDLSSLRGSLAWDEYVKKAGASKAYGWGHAAVAFIEDRAGFQGVVRIVTDAEGPNTMGRFDDVVREVTGLGPAEFDAALKRWVTQQARG